MKRRDDAFLARRDSFLLGPDVSFRGGAEVGRAAKFAASVENDPTRTCHSWGLHSPRLMLIACGLTVSGSDQ
jgi:hypothetical protein